MKHHPEYEENTVTVNTNSVEVYSKDTANSITDKLIEGVTKLFENIVHKKNWTDIKKHIMLWLKHIRRIQSEDQVIFQL